MLIVGLLLITIIEVFLPSTRGNLLRILIWDYSGISQSSKYIFFYPLSSLWLYLGIKVLLGDSVKDKENSIPEDCKGKLYKEE